MSSKDNTAWKVLAHGPLVPLAENLWWVSGALPGMSLKRTMVVVRRDSGELVIHNAIAMNDAQMRELESLGTPTALIVPNGGHRLDAPRFKKRYPQLKVFAPAAARRKVAEVLEVDGSYEDFPSGTDVRLQALGGVPQEGVMWVRSRDGRTLVLNDAVFNMDRKRDLLGFLFTTLLGSAPGPRVSRLARLAYVKDRGAFRAELERFAEEPELVRVIVAHEKVASGEDARAALQKAATYL